MKRQPRPKAEEMDEYLASLNLWRKPIAKDGSCLFRAVSEQLFHTQALHLKVREACIRFMEAHMDSFAAFVEGPFDHHLYNLQNPKEWAGQVELSALSQMYKRDFLVYQVPGHPPVNVTQNGHKDKILLCFSNGNHYDSVYPKSTVEASAICQSIVYELLYEEVFGMENPVEIGVSMISGKGNYRQRKDSLCSEPERLNSPRPETPTEELGGTNHDCKERRGVPFPYRVAKALDPSLYRNTEYDSWMELRKDEQHGDAVPAEGQITPGDKCQVTLEGEDTIYNAFIQEISPDKGPVTVYIAELGEKKSVPFANIKPLPQANQGWVHVTGRGYRNLSGFYQKAPLNDYDSGSGRKGKGRKKRDTPVVLPFGRGQGLPQRLLSQEAVGRCSRGRGITPAGGRGKGAGLPETVETPVSSQQNERDRRPSEDHSDSTDQEAFPALPTQVPSDMSGKSFWGGHQGAPEKKSYATPAENQVGAASGSHGGEVEYHTCQQSQPVMMPMPGTCMSNGITTCSNMSLRPQQCRPVVEHMGEMAPQVPQQSYSQQPMVSQVYVAPQGHLPFPPFMVIPSTENLTGPVNLGVTPSRDPNGADLPLADTNTLRFFFNLGCEYYRTTSLLQMQQSHQHPQHQQPPAYAPTTYINSPVSMPVTYGISQVPPGGVDVSQAASGESETTGQCSSNVTIPSSSQVTSVGQSHPKHDVVYVRDLEHNQDAAREGDCLSPAHDLPTNNDSGCVSDVSSGNGEHILSPTMSRSYGQRHSISEISDHSDTSSQQSVSNSSHTGVSSDVVNPTMSTPQKSHNSSLRGRGNSQSSSRNSRPMRDIPPRFKKMLAQRTPNHKSYEGPPLVRQGGYNRHQSLDSGGMVHDGSFEPPGYMSGPCMECGVHGQVYNGSMTYFTQPYQYLTTPYPSQSHQVLTSPEGEPCGTVGDACGDMTGVTCDNLSVNVGSQPMYTIQLLSPDGGYQESNMSNPVHSPPTGYTQTNSGAAPSHPSGLVYYTNPNYPSQAYMPYAAQQPTGPMIYNGQQQIQYVPYGQPSSNT